MGSPGGEGEADEHPQRQVRSAAFCMDMTEVTVRAYRACTAAGRCSEPDPFREGIGGWSSTFCNWGRSGTETHPVNCVDWNQARNYCAWAGGRLPTEAEWEYAARGSENRRYPWGNASLDSSRANLCGSECTEALRAGRFYNFTGMAGWTDGWGLTAPVGSFPAGNTPDGLQDMGGNVGEWVEDGYDANAYGRSHGGFTAQRTGSQSMEFRVSRGGGWAFIDAARVRAANRNRDSPADRNFYLGFRCARGAR